MERLFCLINISGQRNVLRLESKSYRSLIDIQVFDNDAVAGNF